MAAADVAYAPPMKSGKAGYEGGVPEVQHRIRITLSSRNVKNLEKGTRDPLSTFPVLLPEGCGISASLIQLTVFVAACEQSAATWWPEPRVRSWRWRALCGCPPRCSTSPPGSLPVAKVTSHFPSLPYLLCLMLILPFQLQCVLSTVLEIVWVVGCLELLNCDDMLSRGCEHYIDWDPLGLWCPKNRAF